MVILLVASALARFFWLTRPGRQLIFDENYYVNAARVMIGAHVPHGAPYAGSAVGLDPNTEHPPLGKAVIAGSMRVFGDNPLGWRLPSILAGLAAILLVYLIVRRVSGRPWLAVFAAATFSVDNLVFVHSRLATLDILFVAPALLAVWLLFRDMTLWAGVACGIAILMKLPAIYALLALVALVLFFPKDPDAPDRWRRCFRTAGLLAGAALATALVGLWVLDLQFSRYHSPFTHIAHMVRYGAALSRHGGPIGSESYPWQWLANEVQIPYLRIDQSLSVGGEQLGGRSLVHFRGAMNPAMIGLALVGLSYAGARALRQRDRLAAWTVCWSAGFFVPFLVGSVAFHRISYLYYMLPIVPAIAVANAMLLWHEGVPRAVRWGYAAALAVGVAAYFPFRNVL